MGERLNIFYFLWLESMVVKKGMIDLKIIGLGGYCVLYGLLIGYYMNFGKC